MNYTWGVLGPGRIESVRRVRTLQLAATTRDFNERAVPGLGGVWFGRQLFLATLGLRVAERATARGSRDGKVAVANAVEALACWLAIKGGLRAGERRVRGTTLLAGKADLSFRSVSRPGFYVSQPMRVGTVNALPALGFVEAAGSRFSAFSCSADGDAFIDAVTEGCRPYGRELVEHLAMWVCGETDQVNTDALYRALAPVLPLPLRARELLQTRLEQGAAGESAEDRTRRRDALRWVRARRRGAPPVAWDLPPRRSPRPTTGTTCTPGRCSSSPATRRWRCSRRWSWRSPRRSGGWRSAARCRGPSRPGWLPCAPRRRPSCAPATRPRRRGASAPSALRRSTPSCSATCLTGTGASCAGWAARPARGRPSGAG